MRRAAALLVAAALVAFVYLLAAWLWVEKPAPSPPAAPDAAVTTSPEAPRAEAVPDALDAAAPPLDRTVRDRTVRDEVRRQIFRAWSRASAAAPPSADLPPPDPLRAPMPTLDGGAVDPDYLRARIREDFAPMAAQCYDQWAARAPGAPAGRVVADFVILGDERVGGVVDEVTLESGDRDAGPDAGVLGDGEFQTCLRESMMAMAFRPPPGRGRLRVRYPFRFQPGDGGAPAAP